MVSFQFNLSWSIIDGCLFFTYFEKVSFEKVCSLLIDPIGKVAIILKKCRDSHHKTFPVYIFQGDLLLMLTCSLELPCFKISEKLLKDF